MKKHILPITLVLFTPTLDVFASPTDLTKVDGIIAPCFTENEFKAKNAGTVGNIPMLFVKTLKQV